ncbi:MAG: methyl-coenzyme M reductase operon protein D [archaeon]|nr:methyl-coenzyme M reductase operon protein D [archaeon]MCP8315131.1 methyl-coenzyme M reductase operon protein D [archaeon]MCP8316177.1 methyl-coenzyme M reductase operon protein D [archaeon]MCP8319756.1 methyl-coenzyme M reductase operon protein D [archaeon]
MEIEIFPKRLLSSDTLEELLNSIVQLRMCKSVILQGPRLPKHAINAETGYEDLRRIKFGDREIELEVKVGRIIIQPIEGVDLQDFLNKLKEICNKILPFGFFIKTGQFTKIRPTISDSIKESLKISNVYKF